MQPGDWVCPGCSDLQFSRNSCCRQCGRPRPDEGGGPPQGYGGKGSSKGAYNGHATGKGSSKGSFNGHATGRNGAAWTCEGCGDLQAAHRSECQGCGSPAPSGRDLSAPGHAATYQREARSFESRREEPRAAPAWQAVGASTGEFLRPGDWRCPKCQDHVFARNDACRRCGTDRSGVGPGAGSTRQAGGFEPRAGTRPEFGGRAPASAWQNYRPTAGRGPSRWDPRRSWLGRCWDEVTQLRITKEGFFTALAKYAERELNLPCVGPDALCDSASQRRMLPRWGDPALPGPRRPQYQPPGHGGKGHGGGKGGGKGKKPEESWNIEKLEENPFWWKPETESLCFDLPMCPLELLADGGPANQWWDVEKLAESPYFVAVTKPAGMVVLTDQRGLWEESPTNFVHVSHERVDMPSKHEPRQRGICHRLDRDTSGVQIFGKSWEAFQHFATQNSAHRMHKEYIALVHGRLGGPDMPNIGTVDVPMKKWQDLERREFGSVVCAREGMPAVSKYQVLRQWCVPAKGGLAFWKEDRWFSLVQLRILTGRTHQIRVHMAFLGHPLVADEKYNPSKFEQDCAIVPRIFLHCARMEFEDMDTAIFTATSDLALDLQVALKRLHSLSTAASNEISLGGGALTLEPALGASGLQQLLEATAIAAPAEEAEERCVAADPPKVKVERCFNCRQAEWSCCETFRRGSSGCLVWRLARQEPQGARAPDGRCRQGPAWGPGVLWIPSSLREQHEPLVDPVGPWLGLGASVEVAPDAGSDELGEAWGGQNRRWAWAHDGLRQNGFIHFHAGGVLSSRWGGGTWRLLQGPEPPLILATFHDVEHALRLRSAGLGAAPPGFDMVAKRRLPQDPSLSSGGGAGDPALDPDAPACCLTRGWPLPSHPAATGGA